MLAVVSWPCNTMEVYFHLSGEREPSDHPILYYEISVHHYKIQV